MTPPDGPVGTAADRAAAAKVADEWIVRHATPDRITLTHGAMVNLTNVIAAALSAVRADAMPVLSNLVVMANEQTKRAEVERDQARRERDNVDADYRRDTETLASRNVALQARVAALEQDRETVGAEMLKWAQTAREYRDRVTALEAALREHREIVAGLLSLEGMARDAGLEPDEMLPKIVEALKDWIQEMDQAPGAGGPA